MKTEAGERTIALPRPMIKMLLAHRAGSSYKRPTAFVFCTRTGKPLGQWSVLRALPRAQLRARTADGKPTFPGLFEPEPDRTAAGPRGRGAAQHGAELPQLPAHERQRGDRQRRVGREVSWMLGHRDSPVTRQVYTHELQTAERRARRRALLEERYESALEASIEASSRNKPPQIESRPLAKAAASGAPLGSPVGCSRLVAAAWLDGRQSLVRAGAVAGIGASRRARGPRPAGRCRSPRAGGGGPIGASPRRWIYIEISANFASLR